MTRRALFSTIAACLGMGGARKEIDPTLAPLHIRIIAMQLALQQDEEFLKLLSKDIFRTDPSRQPTRAESLVTAGWQRQGGRTPGEGHASSDLSQSPARTERWITRGEPTREDACFDRGPQPDQGQLSESRAPA